MVVAGSWRDFGSTSSLNTVLCVVSYVWVVSVLSLPVCMSTHKKHNSVLNSFSIKVITSNDCLHVWIIIVSSSYSVLNWITLLCVILCLVVYNFCLIFLIPFWKKHILCLHFDIAFGTRCILSSLIMSWFEIWSVNLYLETSYGTFVSATCTVFIYLNENLFGKLNFCPFWD